MSIIKIVKKFYSLQNQINQDLKDYIFNLYIHIYEFFLAFLSFYFKRVLFW